MFAALVFSSPALASFHLVKITEVFAGAADDPDSQYVELQTYASGQTDLADRRIVVYDASGLEVGSFAFHRALSNGRSGAYALVATPEAQARFGIEADLIMDPVIAASGGKVCFSDGTAPIDCVSWGDYAGDATGTGAPFGAPEALQPDRSMERAVERGHPTRLDEADDTDDTATDFRVASPSPTSSSSGGVIERDVTLYLKRSLIAGGRIVGLEDIRVCVEHVPLAVQRRTDGIWRNLKLVRTDAEGRFRVNLRDRVGAYRAVAKKTVDDESSVCGRAVSDVRRNR
ncbi:MAG: hypothetical protein M3279_11485 [Actinomycetota bacterium]|nr:hypothetical protein [Actinomycetota bacterium]